MDCLWEGYSDKNAWWWNNDDFAQSHRRQEISKVWEDYKLTARRIDAQRKVIVVIAHQMQINRLVKQNIIDLAATILNYT